MILQIANIVSGAVLALPELKQYASNKTSIEKLELQVSSWAPHLGTIDLALGIVGLLNRAGFIPFYIPDFGSSYPQAIPLLVAGLLLSLPKYAKYPDFQASVRRLAPHTLWIGLICIAVGLGSLLFGCFITPFCRVPF